MTLDLTQYLQDLLQDGGAPETLQSNIPTKQSDFVVNEVGKGVISFEPHDGQRNKAGVPTQAPLVLSCGIHGNETAPIEIIDDLLRDLALGNLHIRRPLLIIFGHIEAMKKQERFLDFNLNRLFSGLHQKNPQAMESPRAIELEKAVSNFFSRFGKGLHLDLHTAIRPSHLKRFAVYPTLDNQYPSLVEIDMLKAMGIEGLLLSNESAATFSAFSARVCECQAYTLELGKVEPFGKNNREDFISAQKTLEALIEGRSERGLPNKTENSALKVFKVVHEMIKEDDNYIFHVPEDYANFTPLTDGTPLESTSKGTLRAKENQAIVFPNSKVKIGQRSGLLIEEIESL
jgi:succinylglutamate desuccinylase